MAAHPDEPNWHRITEYSYRRPLRGRELLPAVGIGVGVGLAVTYVSYLLLQRTPLLPRMVSPPPPTPSPRRPSRPTPPPPASLREGVPTSRSVERPAR